MGIPVSKASMRLGWLIAGAALVGGGTMALLGRGHLKRREAQHLYQLQELQLELDGRHNAEIDALSLELDRSNRGLNDFAYVASHDLKEPLRGIAINADFLLREEVSDEVRRRVERMIELSGRMQQLISDLLFFSRLGREENERRNVDLGNVLQGLRIDLGETLEQQSGEVRVVTDLPLLNLDVARAKTVFLHLIMNALIYNDAETKIVEIGFEQEVLVAGRVLKGVFFVRDNGIGIEDRNHDKVFRIFTRLNRENEYGRGTGAGLSFVKKVVESYGGDITFESQMSQGTTFYFPLPLAEESPETKPVHSPRRPAQGKALERAIT